MTAAPAGSPTVDPKKKKDIAQPFMRSLQAIGMGGEFTDSGDIRVPIGEAIFVLLFDVGDPSYVRLCLPGLFEVGEAERAKVLEAANTTTNGFKLAKITVQEESVWISVECFIPNQSYFREYFRRWVSIIFDATMALFVATGRGE